MIVIITLYTVIIIYNNYTIIQHAQLYKWCYKLNFGND